MFVSITNAASKWTALVLEHVKRFLSFLNGYMWTSIVMRAWIGSFNQKFGSGPLRIWICYIFYWHFFGDFIYSLNLIETYLIEKVYLCEFLQIDFLKKIWTSDFDLWIQKKMFIVSVQKVNSLVSTFKTLAIDFAKLSPRT